MDSLIAEIEELVRAELEKGESLEFGYVLPLSLTARGVDALVEYFETAGWRVGCVTEPLPGELRRWLIFDLKK